MQSFARIISVVTALVIALGSSWPIPMASGDAGLMAMPAHATSTDMGAPSDPCRPCSDASSMMQNCVAPLCMSFAAAAQSDVLVFSSYRPSYGSVLADFFDGVGKRPDPYPPRPTILA